MDYFFRVFFVLLVFCGGCINCAGLSTYRVKPAASKQVQPVRPAQDQAARKIQATFRAHKNSVRSSNLSAQPKIAAKPLGSKNVEVKNAPSGSRGLTLFNPQPTIPQADLNQLATRSRHFATFDQHGMNPLRKPQDVLLKLQGELKTITNPQERMIQRKAILDQKALMADPVALAKEQSMFKKMLGLPEKNNTMMNFALFEEPKKIAVEPQKKSFMSTRFFKRSSPSLQNKPPQQKSAFTRVIDSLFEKLSKLKYKKEAVEITQSLQKSIVTSEGLSTTSLSSQAKKEVGSVIQSSASELQSGWSRAKFTAWAEGVSEKIKTIFTSSKSKSIAVEPPATQRTNVFTNQRESFSSISLD